MLMDTSGLMCLFDRDDIRHKDAKTFFNVSPFRITHNYVLAEFVALATARGAPRKLALDFVTNIQDDISVEIVYVDEKLHRVALNLLKDLRLYPKTILSSIYSCPRTGPLLPLPKLPQMRGARTSTMAL